MTLRRIFPLIAALAAFSGLSAFGAEANPFRLRPGAKGAACLECHPDFADTLKLPFVHTPVKSGACSDCHNPHTAEHGKLLAEDPNRICQGCHQDLIPPRPGSIHPAVLEGQCVACHDPHGSKNKNNLRAAGSELCFGCHKPLAESLAAAAFKHSPATRNCLVCHDPHAAAGNTHLLKKDLPGVCLDCHKPDQPAFQARHQNYPVAKGDCSSCHDPHGSSTGALLWANTHKPVASRMCGQCHPEAGSPLALTAKKPGSDLCRGCHNDLFNALAAKKRTHSPVIEKTACLNCHTPHASKAKGLLPASPLVVCGRCHQDAIARQAKSQTKHPPIADGQCSACHDPHAADGVFLLAGATVDETCRPCHDWKKHSTHPIGPEVKDQRNPNLSLDCLSCHRTHGTPFKYLAYFDTKRDLCVACHADLRR